MKLNSTYISAILIFIMGFFSLVYGKFAQFCVFIIFVLFLATIFSKFDNYSTKVYLISVGVLLLGMTYYLTPSFDLFSLLPFIFPILGALVLAVLSDEVLEKFSLIKKCVSLSE